MFGKKKKEKVNETKDEVVVFSEKDLVKETKKDENFIPSENADKYVSLKNINKIYNRKVHAVVDFNLDVKQREFIVFVGPSGCGKSTTLRMIAGLEEISAGELIIDGKYSNDLLAKDRDIAMVFQSYSLYPNMTVRDNLAFSLKIRRLPKEEIDERVKETAAILDIESLLDRKPSQLSGGQRQRVALGRAIIRKAKIFLMDEPLSNLDAKLRVQMRSEIIKLHNKINATTIYVTHDQIEAMTMADRIVVMKDGYIQQIGSPIDIYRHPANKFVAGFLGSPSMNFIEGVYDKKKLTFKDGSFITLNADENNKIIDYYKSELDRIEAQINDFTEFLNEENSKQKSSLFKKAKIVDIENDEDLLKLKKHKEKVQLILNGKSFDLMMGIRPEDIVVDSHGDSYDVILSELLGEQFYVHFMYGGTEFISSIVSEEILKAKDTVKLNFKREKIHIFDYLTGKTII